MTPIDSESAERVLRLRVLRLLVATTAFALVIELLIIAYLLACCAGVAHADARRTLTVEQWRWVQRWFPNDTLTMARITWCESNFRDDVISPAGAIGRLQIMPAHAVRLGIDPVLLHDPEVTGAVAAVLLTERPSASDWGETVNGCTEWTR